MEDLIKLIQGAENPDALENISEDATRAELDSAAVSLGIDPESIPNKLSVAQAIHAAAPSITPDEDPEPEEELSEKQARIQQLRAQIEEQEVALAELRKELDELLYVPPEPQLAQHELLQKSRQLQKKIKAAS